MAIKKVSNLEEANSLLNKTNQKIQEALEGVAKGKTGGDIQSDIKAAKKAAEEAKKKLQKLGDADAKKITQQIIEKVQETEMVLNNANNSNKKDLIEKLQETSQNINQGQRELENKAEKMTAAERQNQDILNEMTKGLKKLGTALGNTKLNNSNTGKAPSNLIASAGVSDVGMGRGTTVTDTSNLGLDSLQYMIWTEDGKCILGDENVENRYKKGKKLNDDDFICFAETIYDYEKIKSGVNTALVIDFAGTGQKIDTENNGLNTAMQSNQPNIKKLISETDNFTAIIQQISIGNESAVKARGGDEWKATAVETTALAKRIQESVANYVTNIPIDIINHSAGSRGAMRTYLEMLKEGIQVEKIYNVDSLVYLDGLSGRNYILANAVQYAYLHLYIASNETDVSNYFPFVTKEGNTNGKDCSYIAACECNILIQMSENSEKADGYNLNAIDLPYKNYLPGLLNGNLTAYGINDNVGNLSVEIISCDRNNNAETITFQVYGENGEKKGIITCTMFLDGDIGHGKSPIVADSFIATDIPTEK
ncbi:MAG: hypothetical protein IKP28_02110 [Clostridia bacterium]|nr:hypothetical protein [Clostridia bacterium]